MVVFKLIVKHQIIVSVTETSSKMACPKNDCSPTRVTRLKVVPNMADPISLKDSDCCLKEYHRIVIRLYFLCSQETQPNSLILT